MVIIIINVKKLIYHTVIPETNVPETNQNIAFDLFP